MRGEWMLALGEVVAALAGCGGHAQPASGQKVYAGELGVLKAPLRGYRAPHLTLPDGAVTVLGRFPLNSIVSFNVPIRNDGSRTLVIRKVDPG